MEKTGGSRLLQMQARFQQKQLQERELKIASLYEAQQARALDRVRHSPSNGMVNGTKASTPQEAQVPVHPGKVRQMFEERRTKAGIDKSYPLQPIHNTDRPAPRKALPNGFTKVTTTNSRVVEKKKQVTATKPVKKTTQHKIENMVNGSGDLNHNHEPDLNAGKRTLPQNNGELITSIDALDKADNNYLLEDETFPEALAPTPTPRSPEPSEPKRPPRRSPANRVSPVKTKPSPQPVAPPRKTTSDNAVSQGSKSKGAMQCAPGNSRTTGQIRRTTAAAPSSGGQGEPCAVCGRRFAPDRLQKHQDICKKANNKKRKPFDALKHRLAGTEAENFKGTEAEPFINKLRKQAHTTGTASSTKVNKPLNNNWRQKHNEFIQAIRAAKQVQAHINAGGKLSDLPPPPPSENPDYIQCPHCNRRFNQTAAERHIPKCATYQFNKPKSQPAARKR
ncbi:uncharacterized protein LOC126374867 isoform X2 [Pectinophora gossypiella]|uniref:uncharacterized protein LOC126374867 isoform X2 n=1 Tax=Pectinophora gossypiella TaxID=13191 RepID=UPI00214F0550|nr:uncharacterized protein LOC126374867 isoform X2 [Pectinophora gossypiella]